MKPLYIAFGLVVSSSSSWATDNLQLALDYLNRMGQAHHSLNYYGTMVYQQGGQVESMRLVHKADDSGEYERVAYISNGNDSREIVRSNSVVTCYLPESKSVMVGHRRFNGALLAKLFTNFQEYGDTYSFHVKGDGRVAGQAVKIVAIRPKDRFRYGYQLWIDEKHGLLMKSDLVNYHGRILEQLMFVDLTVVDKIPDDMIKPETSAESYTWHGKQSMEAGFDQQGDRGWLVKHMPQGFAVTGYYKQLMPNAEQPANHLVLSDGLASVSVYIEQSDMHNRGFTGSSRAGAVNIYGSVFDDYRVTVVGEVPLATVQMIANSVAHEKQKHEKRVALD